MAFLVDLIGDYEYKPAWTPPPPQPATPNYSLSGPQFADYNISMDSNAYPDGLGHYTLDGGATWLNSDGSLYQEPGMLDPNKWAGTDPVGNDVIDMRNRGPVDIAPIETYNTGFDDWGTTAGAGNNTGGGSYLMGGQADQTDPFANFDANDPYNSGVGGGASAQVNAAYQQGNKYVDDFAGSGTYQQDGSGNVWNNGLWYSPDFHYVHDGNQWLTLDEYNKSQQMASDFYGAGAKAYGEATAPDNRALPGKLGNADWTNFDSAMDRPTSVTPSAGWYNIDAALDPNRGTFPESDKYNPTFDQLNGQFAGQAPRTAQVSSDGSNTLSKIFGGLNKYAINPVVESAAQMTGPLLNQVPAIPWALNAAADARETVGLPGFGRVDTSAGGTKGMFELSDAFRESGGNPLKFADIQNKNFAERPGDQQLLASLAYDPTNLIGLGAVSKALKGAEGASALSKILRGAGAANEAIDVGTAKALGAGAKYLGREALGAGVGVGANALAGGQDNTGLDWWQAGLIGALGGSATRKVGSGGISDLLAKAQGRTGLSPALGAQIDNVSDEVPHSYEEYLNRIKANSGKSVPWQPSDGDGISDYERELSEQIRQLNALKKEDNLSEYGAERLAELKGRLASFLDTGEIGSAATNIALRAGASAGAGAIGYATADDNASPTEKLARALGFAALPLAPDAIKAGYKAIPKTAKTALDIPATATLEPLPLGTSGIDKALGRKEATTRSAGKIGERVGKIPGVKKVAGLANPSINVDRIAHVANQAAAAVKSSVSTKFAATRKPILAQVESAFGTFTESADGFYRPSMAIQYTGPADRTIAGTLVDIAENPQDYILTPFQKATIDLMESRDAMNVNLLRTQYGVDVSLVKPETGGIYMPRIQTNEDLIAQGLSTTQRLTNPGIGKTRYYETAADRIAHDVAAGTQNIFIPETNPQKLLELHDNALARMAGDNTFKAGSGGKTKVQLIDEYFPKVLEAKTTAQKKLTSLKGILERRLAKEGDLVGAMRKNLQVTRALDDRMEPMLARIKELEATGEYGPELSHLTGQVYELRRDAAVLERLVAGTPKKAGQSGKVIANDVEIRSLMKQVDEAQTRVEKLIKSYSSLNFAERSGKVRNKVTNLYHDPSVSQGIDELRWDLTGSKGIDNAVKFLDYSRGTALSADGSPISIQGVIGFLRDPISTAMAIGKMFKEGGANLADVALREPEMVERYTQAKARAFGSISDEFDPTESLIGYLADKKQLKAISKAAGGIKGREQAMFDILQRIDYETWKNTNRLAAWMNPNMTADVIDHEVANALSKSSPSMSSVERGVSPGRGKIERAAITSTSFLGSAPTLMKDSASAIAKLAVGQRPRVREQVALAHMLTMSTTIATAVGASAVLSAESRNLSPEEALKRAFNPNRKEFMALEFGNGNRVPLGGPFRSFLKAMNPVSSDLRPQTPDLYNWATGKMAPAFSAGYDVFRDKDFSGDKVSPAPGMKGHLQSFEYFIEQGLMPLSLGAAAESLRKGESTGTILTSGASQLLGTTVAQPSPTDKLDTIARGFPDNEGRDFWGSPAGIQRQIRELHPELYKESVEASSDNRKAVYEREQKIIAEQLAADTALKNNDIDAAQWRDMYSKKYADLSSFKSGVYADAGTFEGNDPVLDKYFKAIDQAAKPSATNLPGDVDWDRVEAYLNTLSQGDRDYIEANTHLAMSTDKTKEYRGDMAKIDKAGYWAIEDDVWTEYAKYLEVPGTTNPKEYWTALRKDVISEAEKYLDGKYPDWRTKTPNAAVELGDNQFTTLKNKFTNVVSDERAKWREEHPAEAAILAKWKIAGYGKTETAKRIDEANQD